MSQIQIVEVGGKLVIDSRIIAEQLGVDHHNVMATIYKFQVKLEANFGHLPFKTETVRNSVGAINEIKYALLTEDQAIALLTLSRNTERVVDLKFELVKQFQTQKRLLEDSTDRELRTVIYREQQKALPPRSEARINVTTESQIFSIFCQGRGYPVCQVHNYITTTLTGMTAKQLRDIDWVDGASHIGLNHIVSLEQLLLVSSAKLHFARIKRLPGVSETWEQRADRAIAKALPKTK